MSNEKDPNTLEVAVSDSVGVAELTPGGATKPAPEKTEEEAQKEREEAIRKVLERKVELADKYVTPHNKPARRVKEADIPRLLEDAKIMHEMCMVGRGEYNTAYALAHTQICKPEDDPLRFFVTVKGEIYINPVIVGKSHELEQVKEGCMSYPEEPMTPVIRFKTVTVKYRTLAHKVHRVSGETIESPYLTKEIFAEFDGTMSHIIQHECLHLNGWDIYMPGTSSLKVVGEPK